MQDKPIEITHLHRTTEKVRCMMLRVAPDSAPTKLTGTDDVRRGYTTESGLSPSARPNLLSD